jgi:hypothetical protein
LDCGQLAKRVGPTDGANDNYTLHVGRNLLEQFKPLRAQADFKRGKASRVAAGMREALDHTVGNRVDDRCKHNRQGLGLLEQRGERRLT